MIKKRIIKNFSPNKKEAKLIGKKRIKNYLLILSIFILLEIIGLVIAWIFGSKDQFKTLGLVLTALHFLATATFFVIFDNGAANMLKKKNFKIKGITSNKQGHTYYYALKYSGFIRLFINLVLTIIIVVITLISFLI